MPRKEARAAVGLLWLMTAGLAVSLRGQQAAPQQPVFRAEVSVVEVSAVVTDEAGQPVRDLTAQDFEIFEDGVLRPLVSMRRLEPSGRDAKRQAGATPDATHTETLVTNREAPDAPAFVLLLDDLNVSPYDTHRAISAGLGLLDALPHEALFAVGTTSGADGGLLTLRHPTSAHAEQIRRFRGQLLLSGPPQRSGIPQTMPSAVSAPCGVGSATLNSQDCGDPTRAARRIQAVGLAAQILGRAGSRRKVLFWLTTDMGVSPLNPESTRSVQRIALGEVLNSDVAVYPVDPRENYTSSISPYHEFDRRTGGSLRAGTASTALSGSGGDVMSLDTDDMVAVTLEGLARESGGRRIANVNKLGTVLARVVKENNAPYILAYESAAWREPGRHRIDVKVRRAGVRVYARRGYVNAPDLSPIHTPVRSASVEALLQRTLLGSVSQGQVGLRAQIVPRFAASGHGKALITVGIEPLPTGSRAPVTLAIVTVDREGKVTSYPLRAIAAPVPGSLSEVSAELPLATGTHQIRIAAATADGSASGLVLDELDIIQPAGDLIMATPVVLDHRGGVHATVVRSFEVGHPLGIQVELGGRAVERTRVSAGARLLDPSGAEVRAVEAVIDKGERRDTVQATAVVSTTDLRSGEYVLVVEARPHKAGRALKSAIRVRLGLDQMQ